MQLSFTDFPTRCHAWVTQVEKGNLILQITRQGKVIAKAEPSGCEPAKAPANSNP